MKLPPFDYEAPESVSEAVDLLAEYGDEANVLAGGQSLIPLLALRLARPAVLIDINGIAELSGVSATDGWMAIGAMTREYVAEESKSVADTVPLLAAALPLIGHEAIRSRGTIGGSLAHADPAAELPLMAMLLDAELHVAAPSGKRCIAARDFFVDALTVDLAGDELVTEIVLPKLPPQTGWGFEEVARRHGDFALAAVAITLTVAAGEITQARVALTGVGPTPCRIDAAEALLTGHALEPNLTLRAIAAVRAAITPETDLHASADYRRHLAGVLTGRTIDAAWRRAMAARATAA